MNVIDVSIYQQNIDWAQVKAAGVGRAIVKLSEGINVHDSLATEHCAGARAAGLEVHGYHFARLSSAASANAQNAIDRAHACGVQVVWLDFEDDKNPLGPEDATAWVLGFLNAIGQAGLEAGFYTYSGYVSHLAPHQELAAFPLWLANYGPNNGLWPPNRPAPMVPAPWTSLTGWQHTSVASVPGIAGHVDVSWFTDTAPTPPPPTGEEDFYAMPLAPIVKTQFVEETINRWFAECFGSQRLPTPADVYYWKHGDGTNNPGLLSVAEADVEHFKDQVFLPIARNDPNFRK